MIDRGARDKAAELLRRFASGQLSNDEFEDGVPITEDSAVRAIWQTAWIRAGPGNLHRTISGVSA